MESKLEKILEAIVLWSFVTTWIMVNIILIHFIVTDDLIIW